MPVPQKDSKVFHGLGRQGIWWFMTVSRMWLTPRLAMSWRREAIDV